MSSEIAPLDRMPVLRIIPSGNTVRPSLPFTVNSSKPGQKLLPLGVVCWLSWYAEDVASVFPDQALALQAPGLFFVCDSCLQQFC